MIQAVRLANELKEGLTLNALSDLLIDGVCQSWELGFLSSACVPMIRRVKKRRAGEGEGSRRPWLASDAVKS